jgi:hypothetical protein
LNEGSPPVPDKDGPTIIAMTSLASRDSEAYNTPRKEAIPITTRTTLIPYRSNNTSARPDYGSKPDDAPVLVQGRFGWRAPREIPACWSKRSLSKGRISRGREWERGGTSPSSSSSFSSSPPPEDSGSEGVSSPPPPRCPRGRLGSTPRQSPLPLCSRSFIVGTVGLPLRRILR